MSVILKKATLQVNKPDGTQQAFDVVTDNTREQAIEDINAAKNASLSEIDEKKNEFLESIPTDYTTLENDVTELKQDVNKKTEKVRIDYMGNKVFKLGEQTLNYKQLHDIHLVSPDFAFVQYGDRAYLLSYVQDDPAYMREMRFESVIAATDANLSFVKTSGIYVKSSDGVNIAGVDMTDISSENKAYKATVIDDSHKNDVWYPTVKAVADYVDPAKADVETLKDDLTKKVGYSEVVGNQLLMYSDATKTKLLATLDLPTPDLTDYIKNTDYAGTSKGGIILPSGTFGFGINSTGNPYALARNASAYKTANGGTFVGKTTLDNVLAAPSTMPALTATEQSAARMRIGLPGDWVQVVDFTSEEDVNTVLYLEFTEEVDEVRVLLISPSNSVVSQLGNVTYNLTGRYSGGSYTSKIAYESTSASDASMAYIEFEPFYELGFNLARAYAARVVPSNGWLSTTRGTYSTANPSAYANKSMRFWRLIVYPNSGAFAAIKGTTIKVWGRKK